MRLCRFASLLFLLAFWSLASVTIIVQDPQGASIPGASVFTATQHYLTNEEGRVEIQEPLPMKLRITAPGFASQVVMLTEESPRTLVLYPETQYSSVDVVVRETPGVGPVLANAVEIERTGARTVLDAVDRLIPGAYVTRRSVMGYGIASGGTGVVTIRGVGNSPNTGVLIVVDGRPDYMGLMGHPLPDFYSLTDAESIRVIEGPASVLYGSNAMGGVVEVRPARPTEGYHTELSASLGSFWTGQHRLRHGGGFSRGFYQLTAGVEHTSGHRPSSDFRNQDATFGLGYDLSSSWKTTLRGRYGHFHVEDPGPVTAPKQNSYARVGRGGFNWAVENTYGRSWGNAQVFSSWGHHLITDGWRSNDRTTGARWHQSWLAGRGVTLEGGFDAVNYGGEGRNILQRIDYGHHEVTSAAGFSRLNWLVAPAVRVHAGFRYEHNSVFGGIAVPEAGAAIRLHPQASLHLSFARGFRNPTIRELYLFPAPNPELEPERMWNYQATLELRPVEELAASVTGYYADLSNLIVVTGRYPNLRMANAGAALNRGLETNVRWRLQRRLAFHAGYGYLRSTNLPPYVPRHKAVYSMEIDAGRAFVYLGGVTVGRRWADTSRKAELDGYTVPTVKLMVPWRQVTFFAEVENFTDETYQVVTGYPMPGATASGGFTWRF